MGETTAAFRGVWRTVIVGIMGSHFCAKLVMINECSSVTGPQGHEWVIGRAPSHFPFQFHAFPEDQHQSVSLSYYTYMEKLQRTNSVDIIFGAVSAFLHSTDVFTGIKL